MLAFLPLALGGFFAFGIRGQQRLALGWLTLMSLVFYGWWNPVHVPLLIASMGCNYLLGRRLGQRPSRALLVAGVLGNVLLLGYFKYTGFAVETLDGVFGLDWTVPHIVLPLAISFFTFQQIAYLSDAHDGVAVEHDFLNYCLFVTFFPHLIAGPITHHREMLTQFADRSILKPRADLFSIGATLFLLGLFKKVVIADQISTYVAPVFAAAAAGHSAELTLLPAWGGALAYTLQIYFDFSGYTDMAIGLGLLFGISLPPNFDSPYKARNIIDFWSRWHMTLTRFLTAYVYNPIVLAMSRRRLRAGLPMPRRGKMTAGAFVAIVAFPTVLTMFVSGFWHGAGWQFIVFGLLHGAFLTVNHGWRALKARQGWPMEGRHAALRPASVLLTFVCVVVAQVFFRAPDVGAALAVLSGMAGLNGIAVDWTFYGIRGLRWAIDLLGLPVAGVPMFKAPQAATIAGLLLVVWTMPNTQQWMRHYRTALDARPGPSWLERLGAWLPLTTWRPTVACGAAVGVIGFFALARALSVAPSEFLYFQF
jgi:D-alanyl-lipoteichoic acid acyltransferase DltB (MBOAT superfamily)